MKVSGPINIVRLESFEKELYLFFEYHEDINEQTHCKDEESTDVDLFLDKLFSQYKEKCPDTMLDFFLEISPGRANEPPSSNTSKLYIDKMEQWMMRNFSLDKQGNVNSSNDHDNVRFHYIDIRNHYKALWDENVQQGTIEDLCHISVQYISELIDIFEGKDTDTTTRTNFLIKIIHAYRNAANKSILKKYCEHTMIPFLRKAKKYIEKNSPIMTHYVDVLSASGSDKILPPPFLRTRQKQEIIHKPANIHCRLVNFIDKVSAYWVDILVRIVDLYFIRRFVDKDYVRHAFLYSGCYHSINIIIILVKYFGFRVTDCAYSTVDVKELNDIILDSSNDKPEILIDYLWPPDFLQCSETGSIPFFQKK